MTALSPSQSALPFDAVAGHYDQQFTHTSLGRALRARVWQRLAERFPPGSRVLELNCGTGEDAAWLASRGVRVVATDVSPAMLAETSRKTAGLSVEVLPLDLADPRADFSPGSFDGVFSNFGGLNCVADLQPLARVLSDWLKPGAAVIFVVMGPICPWEICRHLLHGQPRTAFRRWSRGEVTARVGKQTLHVVYPWPRDVVRVFSPEFRRVRIMAVGVALPPSPMAGALERRGRLLRFLNRLEGRIAPVWPLAHLGDHYLLEMERR